MTASKPKKPRKRGTVSVLTEQEKVAVHLYIKHGSKAGPGKIAEALEVNLDVVKGLLKLPKVQNYLQSYNHEFLKQMARYELSQVTKYAVTRDDIIGRLYILALTPPEDTKGNIEGQVEAMSAIVDLLGLKFSPRDADTFFKGRTPEELELFVKFGRFDAGGEPIPQS